MPDTMMQNTMGVIIMLSSLMKPSPSGFNVTATLGHAAPTMIAATIATITWLCSFA